MPVVRELLVSFGAQLDPTSMKEVDSKVKGAAEGMKAVFEGAFLVGIAKGILGLTQMASNVEETANVINNSFGDSADAVRQWATDFGDAAGRSRYELEATASSFGAILTPMMDGNKEAAAEMSMSIAQLSVDLGSFYNMADSDVSQKLVAGLTGEAEPMKRLGIIMNDATLTTFALTQENKKAYKSMTNAEKTQLRYNFIMSQTVLAQGDAVNTAAGWANATKNLNGKISEFMTDIGMVVLPYMTKLVHVLTKTVSWFVKMVRGTNLMKAALITLGAVAAGIGIKLLIAFWPVLLPLLKIAAIFAVITLIVDDFLTFLDGGNSVIGTFIDKMFGPGSAEDAVRWLKDSFAALSDYFINVVVPGFLDLKNKIVEFWTVIKPYADDFMRYMGYCLGFVFNLWVKLFDFIFNQFLPNLRMFGEEVVKILTTIKDWFKDVFDTYISVALNKAIEKFGYFADKIRGFLKKFGIDLSGPAEAAKGVASSVWDKVSGYAGSILGGSNDSMGGKNQDGFRTAPLAGTAGSTINQQTTVVVQGNASLSTAERIGKSAGDATGRELKKTASALRQKK